VYLTLGISGPSCAGVVQRALAVPPSLMPIPGPPSVAWRSPSGEAALLTWPAVGPVTQSHAGTIVALDDALRSRPSMTRVDSVFEATAGDCVVLSDRATWAAAACERDTAIDPMLIAQLVNAGYPLGSTTPFRGVQALPGAPVVPSGGSVASAVVAAVAPLASAGSPVELSLTGGKDSRLVAAALAAAGVPFRARTHGFADHPDVEIAGAIAARLGIEHIVATPAAPGSTADPLHRLRSAVLVGDGMISAFENVGYPDPTRSEVVSVGGHGGEILRGGYAEVVAARQSAPAPGARRPPLPMWASPALRQFAASAELLRRMTARRLRLLRPGTAAAYAASLAPQTARLRRGPLTALDDFYLANRAGRWSAAARQAYLLRQDLVQPLFADAVVAAARSVPLASRVSGELTSSAIAELRPDLLEVPFAGKGPATKTFDWRRDPGPEIAGFFREYILSAMPLFEAVSRPAAERLLAQPHPDPGLVWSLATLACLTSGDYRDARQPSPRTYPVG
jgi:Asparagine synthase